MVQGRKVLKNLPLFSNKGERVGKNHAIIFFLGGKEGPCFGLLSSLLFIYIYIPTEGIFDSSWFQLILLYQHSGVFWMTWVMRMRIANKPLNGTTLFMFSCQLYLCCCHVASGWIPFEVFAKSPFGCWSFGPPTWSSSAQGGCFKRSLGTMVKVWTCKPCKTHWKDE